MIYIPPNSYFNILFITPQFLQTYTLLPSLINTPQILSASFMSFGIIVTCFACIAHKLVSSNSLTRNASAASCIAKTVVGVRQRSNCIPCKISLTRHRNGSLQISSSIDIWNFLISLNATVPGQNWCSLFTPPVPHVPLFCVAFIMKCFGPSLFLTVVFFVLAMF